MASKIYVGKVRFDGVDCEKHYYSEKLNVMICHLEEVICHKAKLMTQKTEISN